MSTIFCNHLLSIYYRYVNFGTYGVVIYFNISIFSMLGPNMNLFFPVHFNFVAHFFKYLSMPLLFLHLFHLALYRHITHKP